MVEDCLSLTRRYLTMYFSRIRPDSGVMYYYACFEFIDENGNSFGYFVTVRHNIEQPMDHYVDMNECSFCNASLWESQ